MWRNGSEFAEREIKKKGFSAILGGFFWWEESGVQILDGRIRKLLVSGCCSLLKWGGVDRKSCLFVCLVFFLEDERGRGGLGGRGGYGFGRF